MEMLPALNFGDNVLQGQAIGLEIDRLGIKLALGTKAIKIDKSGVLGESPEGQKMFAADTVVCAAGRLPLREEVDELRFCAPEFHQIADCLVPKTVFEATRTAHNIALDIGEH